MPGSLGVCARAASCRKQGDAEGAVEAGLVGALCCSSEPAAETVTAASGCMRKGLFWSSLNGSPVLSLNEYCSGSHGFARQLPPADVASCSPWSLRGAGWKRRAGPRESGWRGEAGSPWSCLPSRDPSCETPTGRNVQLAGAPGQLLSPVGRRRAASPHPVEPAAPRVCLVTVSSTPCPPGRGSARDAEAASLGSLLAGASSRQERVLRLRRQTGAARPREDGTLCPCDDGQAGGLASPLPTRSGPSRDLHLNIPVEGTLQQPQVI